jgi:hypothetical protein
VGKKSLCPETHFFSYKRYFLKKLILYKGKRKIWASGRSLYFSKFGGGKMNELEKKKMFNQMVGDYMKKEVGYVDEQDATDDIQDKFVWKAPEEGKKLPQNYICDKCGRIKTVRFKENPTPVTHGKCPRCKEGTMVSELFKGKNIKHSNRIEKLQGLRCNMSIIDDAF